MLFAWLYRLRRIRAPGSAALPRGAAAALLTVAVASASTWGGCNHLGVDPDDTDSDPEQTTLAFADPGTLELKPTQVVDIEILTDGSENVTLLLLGDALDASLQDAVVRSSSKGRAIATLTAPSQPTAFVVRAQIASEAFVELHVAVSEQGFTTLRIVPKYDGKRSLDGWSADVVVAGQCDTLLATYPEDPVGALHVEANKQVPLELGSVPVGPQLALAVHSGSLVAGCVNFAATKPGDTEEIEVVVLDRPMALGDAELEILLELAPDPEAYGTLIEESGKVVASCSRPWRPRVWRGSASRESSTPRWPRVSETSTPTRTARRSQAAPPAWRRSVRNPAEARWRGCSWAPPTNLRSLLSSSFPSGV